MTTFWLLMAVIVFGSLFAIAVLYGVMRLVGLVLLGVARLLAWAARAAGRGAWSAVHAAALRATPLVHGHGHRHRHAA